tara:strand:- start:278 stop:577 length:300 start_codon:yes stop_codon:yes gene_type:complete
MVLIWLASYPRSGNTYLKTILYHCFKLKTGSFYPNDFSGNKALEHYVGHIEHENNDVIFPEGQIKIMKTHELDNFTKQPAIYIIREFRAVIASYWYFYQ